MVKLVVIHCTDCGAPRVTARRNTKYCYLCRLLRNIIFVGTRTFKCSVCEKRLQPCDRNQDLCCECNPYLPGSVQGDCKLCGREDVRLLGDTIAVCDRCANDPKMRSKLKAALILKQKMVKEGTIVYDEPELPEDVTGTEAQGQEVAI